MGEQGRGRGVKGLFLLISYLFRSDDGLWSLKAPVSYTHLDVYKRQVERKLREELEILKEREKGLDNLINIKIKFDNEEIFYNMIKK